MLMMLKVPHFILKHVELELLVKYRVTKIEKVWKLQNYNNNKKKLLTALWEFKKCLDLKTY